MLQTSHITDPAAAIVAAVIGLSWLVTFYLRSRVKRAQQRINDLALELSGAQHRLDQARDQVALSAHHDPLTGLLVRGELERGFQTALAIAKRTEAPFGIVLIDLPTYEAVSARLGDEAADRVLAAFAQRLRTVTRDMDMVARVGDYQFAALLPRLNGSDDMDVVTRKLRAELERPFKLSGLEEGVRVQTCFGHACFPRDGADWTSMMKVADERLARSRVLVHA